MASWFCRLVFKINCVHFGAILMSHYGVTIVAACKTIYLRKTIYFAYAKLYVLYMVYTFAYAKTYTCAKHIVLHMQNYMFCITYEELDLWRLISLYLYTGMTDKETCVRLSSS